MRRQINSQSRTTCMQNLVSRPLMCRSTSSKVSYKSKTITRASNNCPPSKLLVDQQWISPSSKITLSCPIKRRLQQRKNKRGWKKLPSLSWSSSRGTWFVRDLPIKMGCQREELVRMGAILIEIISKSASSSWRHLITDPNPQSLQLNSSYSNNHS